MPHSAIFASSQVDAASMPETAAAMAAMASGTTPDPATTGAVWRTIPESAPGAYRSLVRAPSGVSVGDGPVGGNGMWFLRSDGTRLLLVGPAIQGACASKLSRVRR